VQPDDVEVMDFSKRESKSSGEAEPKYEVKGEDALNQDNVLLKHVNLDKELKVIDFSEDDVKSDDKLKVSGFVEDEVKSENKLMVIGSLEDDVKSDLELKVTRTHTLEEAHPGESQLMQPSHPNKEENLLPVWYGANLLCLSRDLQ